MMSGAFHFPLRAFDDGSVEMATDWLHKAVGKEALRRARCLFKTFFSSAYWLSYFAVQILSSDGIQCST